jgi:hypothetical protein
MINYDDSVFQTLLTFLCMYLTKVLVNSIVHTAVKQACQVTLQAFTNPIDSAML